MNWSWVTGVHSNLSFCLPTAQTESIVKRKAVCFMNKTLQNHLIIFFKHFSQNFFYCYFISSASDMWNCLPPSQPKLPIMQVQATMAKIVLLKSTNNILGYCFVVGACFVEFLFLHNPLSSLIPLALRVTE